jgi:hypothetical protein
MDIYATFGRRKAITATQVTTSAVTKTWVALIQLRRLRDSISNLFFTSTLRKTSYAGMEKQLRQQDIPYPRVKAVAGQKEKTRISNLTTSTYEPICGLAQRATGQKDDYCDGDIGQPGEGKCKGVAGLALSNIQIIDEGDHSKGLSLVLEDCVVIKDIGFLMASIKSDPKDWGIIRWNCTAERDTPLLLPVSTEKFFFRSHHVRHCKPTYAMLWKNTSLPKLRAVWAERPFTDIDGRLKYRKA